LTVELVPATCWYSNVRTAVTQGDWDRIRHQVYDRAGHRCEICGGHGPKPRVHCHEIWTYDDHEHIQRLVDLIALCPYCHEVKHLGHANTTGHGDRARQWLAKINHWTAHQADAYLEHQFAIWEQRSLHDGRQTWSSSPPTGSPSAERPSSSSAPTRSSSKLDTNRPTSVSRSCTPSSGW
jgi:hypothetical protein